MAEENKNIKGKINELAVLHTDAYALAVANGFKGTIVEWLNSLVGKSAYDLAVIHGFEGTEEEWLDSLVNDVEKRAAKAIEDADAEIALMKETSATEQENIDEAANEALSDIAEAKSAMLSEIEIAAEIVQTTGDSETAVMSQKATTTNIHLLNAIKGTTQTVTFNSNGTVQTVTHKDSSGKTLRTDSFTYGTDTITETRTLASGETLTITTNTKTLTTEVK